MNKQNKNTDAENRVMVIRGERVREGEIDKAASTGDRN